MPKWPMAMPSQMPGMPKTKGTPPAAATPRSMKRSSERMSAWPGIRSVKLEAMPMSGLPICERVTPVANISARCGMASSACARKSLGRACGARRIFGSGRLAMVWVLSNEPEYGIWRQNGKRTCHAVASGEGESGFARLSTPARAYSSFWLRIVYLLFYGASCAQRKPRVDARSFGVGRRDASPCGGRRSAPGESLRGQPAGLP